VTDICASSASVGGIFDVTAPSWHVVTLVTFDILYSPSD